MPDCDQDDRADQCPEKRDTKDLDVAYPSDDDDACEQPDTNKCRDDGTDEAEWQSPANKRLCDEANDRRNEQVHEKVEAERPYMTAKLNGDTICQDEVQS